MRVSKIDFKGYQRLAETACNTSGKMIAFLGPNEAGKTTVLRALDWFSNGEGALPFTARNNKTPPVEGVPVVNVTYWLDPEDLKAIEDLNLADPPTFFSRGRRVDGVYENGLVPSGRRNTAPFEEALELFQIAFDAEGPFDEDESEPHLANYAATVHDVLANPDGGWDEEWDEDWAGALDRLEGIGAMDAIVSLNQIRTMLSAEHPNETARRILRNRAPAFVLFGEEDRGLRSSYDLADETLRNAPPHALANLAWVADLDLADLWEAMETDQKRKARTAERRANEALEERLGQRWRQKGLDVEFNVSGTELEINVSEHASDGATTPVEERSDGLRTFIALVAFLARHNFDVPPVLLVDEIETHLHYDAQADLIEVLTSGVEATQVFYTTHSPGCLPRDLGTGIRLVQPIEDRSDASRLRNDFWTIDDSPGFTPLLFAMGAGAAAFSAFRRAVLTEGAGDMILLPSLMRRATDSDDLDYQVAPGIANYHGTGLELEEVAARVVYLVDGDEGGNKHLQRLREMEIPEDRIKQLPAPKAIEDFVHPDRYLAVVNAFFLSTGNKKAELRFEELDKDVSISKAVEAWCKTHKIKPPGKTVIATQLITEPGSLELADGAKETLAALHVDILKALNATPSGK
ncbi:AAA family ATPase [Nocardioides sp. NBC_00850]|uniref:AAA family ATPase n=1 Tax=Nocardioides sp. NBC_00850 TaxID=2976001 RepID=UPI003870763D|nr:AAA family ATPase [Nocardioides sp. NBC_00850]